MLKNQQKNCIFYSFFTNFVKFNVNFNIFFIKNPLLISAKNTHNMIKYKIPFCEHVIVKIS